MSVATQAAAGLDVAVLIASCDKYADLWAPFAATLRKYWPDCPFPVYLGSGKIGCDEPDIAAITIGADVSYSDNLRKMLRRIPNEWVILWVDDRMLCDRVDTERVVAVIREGQGGGFGYVKLVAGHPYAYGCGRASRIGAIPPRMPYRTSFTIGLWKKSVLLELLRPGESPWELEKNGSRRSDAMLPKFGALAPTFGRKPLFPHAHIVVKGKLVRDALPFLSRMKLRDCLSGRPVEPITSHLYGRLYHILFSIVRPIQYWRLRAGTANG